MKKLTHFSTPPKPKGGLLANVDRSNPDEILFAFRVLRQQHRQRPDVQRKLLELVERKLGATK